MSKVVDSEQDTKQDSEDANQRDEAVDSSNSRTTAEKISFTLALGVLIVIIGSVSYLWVSDRNRTPPVLQITADSPEQRQGTYYVPFTVENSGGKTAATVQVIAELSINGEVVEWGEQTVDFLSREEQAAGAFMFRRDPTIGELTVRVGSYSEP